MQTKNKIWKTFGFKSTKSYYKKIMMLNNIENCLITPCLAFSQNFQLQGYGRYKIYGSVVNVPTNLNLLRNVLLCMPYDDLSIVILKKRKLEYI